VRRRMPRGIGAGTPAWVALSLHLLDIGGRQWGGGKDCRCAVAVPACPALVCPTPSPCGGVDEATIVRVLKNAHEEKNDDNRKYSWLHASSCFVLFIGAVVNAACVWYTRRASCQPATRDDAGSSSDSDGDLADIVSARASARAIRG
jgi:hypothetical protein